MDRRLHAARNDLAVAIGTLHALIDGKLAADPQRLARVLGALEAVDGFLAIAPAPVTAKEHLLNAVIEGSPYAKVLVNEAGTIVLVNAQTEALFGYARHELLGASIELLVPRRFRPAHPDLRSVFAAAPMARPMGAGRDLYGRRKDGSDVPIEIGLNPIATGDETFTLAAITDITERKRAATLRHDHGVIQRHATELERLNAELADASRFKTEFVATMSHELRTPLSAIIGAAELLSSADLDPRARRIVKTMSEASESLLALINSVLDFSKIEAGKLEIQTAAFDVDLLVEGAANVAAGLARAKGVTLHTFIHPGIPAVLGDQDRLRQVFINLIGNAVKFTDRGSIVVRADLLAPSAAGVRVRFDVSDTGIGIAAHLLTTLFEPFAQADRSASRRFGGTGLGLSISKRLVELMGGEIGVRSELGSGSSFWFTLTFDRAQPATTNARVIDDVAALIVSGDETFAAIIAAYVESWAIRSVRVGSLAELAERLHDPQQRLVAVVDVENIGIVADLAAITNVDRAAGRVIAVGGEGIQKPIRGSQLFDAIVAARSHHVSAGAQSIARGPNAGRPELDILVAEDNQQLANLLQLQFSELGVEATFVADGLQAVEAVRRGRFALVFMDCQMPNLDGLEATKRIRFDEGRHGRHIPIAAMTANAFTEDRAECIRAGMDDYLAKPVKLSDLRTMIDRWATRS